MFYVSTHKTFTGIFLLLPPSYIISVITSEFIKVVTNVHIMEIFEINIQYFVMDVSVLNGFILMKINIFHNYNVLPDSPFCATRQTFKYAAHFGETISINCNVEAFPAFATTFDWSQNDSRLLTTTGSADSQQSNKTHSVLNYTI